jgi:hypothetical protein
MFRALAQRRSRILVVTIERIIAENSWQDQMGAFQKSGKKSKVGKKKGLGGEECGQKRS